MSLNIEKLSNEHDILIILAIILLNISNIIDRISMIDDHDFFEILIITIRRERLGI